MPHLLPKDDPGAVSPVHARLGRGFGADPTPKIKGATHVNSERGKELFHSVGCVACHAAGTDFQPVEGAPKPEEFTYPAQAFHRALSKIPATQVWLLFC